MSELLSLQDMANGHLDVKALGEAANGDENTIVTTRTGKTYPSAERAINIMFQNGGLPATPFATKAKMQTDGASLAEGQLAQVYNEAANNGLYVKEAGGWVKSAYDPVSQTKSYVDPAIYQSFKVSDFTSAGFIQPTGVYSVSAGFKATDYLLINADTQYDVTTTNAGISRNAWYDKDKVFISAFGQDQSGKLTVTSPSNAYYLRVSNQVGGVEPSIRSTNFNYDIKKVKDIVEQHLTSLEASKIVRNGITLPTILDAISAKQQGIVAKQNNIISQLDIQSDKAAPLFLNTFEFVKSSKYPTNFDVVNITAHTVDTMTVSDATAFIVDSSCVVYDATANSYTSHAVVKIVGNIITVAPDLPSNPTSVQTMHDSAQGQHLTMYGYRGLADFTAEQNIRHSYKKADNLLFEFNPADFLKHTESNGQITTDGTTVAIPVTRLGTAKSGGYVAGTTDFVKFCDMTSTLNIGSESATQYVSKAYGIQDTTAGNGIEITFDAQDLDGFIEIPIAARSRRYKDTDNVDKYTTGKARLQVLNGAAVIHDATYKVGNVNYIKVDFEQADTLTVRVTCAENKPTAIYLCGIFAYQKSNKTPTTKIFKSGDVVAFLGDSWTQFPLSADGVLRPDGTKSEGTQTLSERLRTKLASEGTNITTLNYGKGGQTSRWGLHWVDTIINASPRPTHCFVCFYINDNNSINLNTTAYDFDPVNMYVNKPVSEGGLAGRVSSYQEWLDNIKAICERLANAGIKPIVIMPSQTGSDTQSQAIRNNQVNMMADGF